MDTNPHVARRIDVSAVAFELRAGTASNQWLARWLPETYAQPLAFEQALRAHAALRRGGLKSSPSGVIDFYYDCVTAHLGQQKRALVVREKAYSSELSYEALHVRCGALLSAWAESGVEPGQCVCLVLPMGVDYVVALMTALRMGLIVCSLPPQGPTFLRHRLEALAPDAVVADDRSRSSLQNWGFAALSTSGTRDSGAAGSHGYRVGDPALRLFSRFGDPGQTPLDLAAGPLHAGLLRDALLVFALDAKDTLAMPGFDALTCQPTALLSTLLAGASWAELSVPDLASYPLALAEQGVTVLGVNRELREQLLAGGKWPNGQLRAWFRLLTDALEIPPWDAFGRLALAAGVAGFSLALSAAAGGALLFSAPLREGLGLLVWPPPGQSFQLSEVGAAELLALGDAGIYTRLLGQEVVSGAPRIFLTRAADGYVFSGSIDVGPDSMTYPIDEVGALIEQHPCVEYASVVVTPGRMINDARVTLLVFVENLEDLARASVPSAASALSALIGREMGSNFLPSRIEILPLRPRVIDGAVDRSWCRSQYLSGALGSKSRREIFLLLSRLGYLLDVRERASG